MPDFLLLETGDRLLTEASGSILLETTSSADVLLLETGHQLLLESGGCIVKESGIPALITGSAAVTAAPATSTASGTVTIDYLLLETGDRLLLESGDALLLETMGPALAPAPLGGGADDTAQLQAWINSLDHGDTAQFPANAAYVVDGSLSLHSRTGLTFVGNGASFTATATDSVNAMWLMINASQLSFDGMTIVGENPDPGINGAGSAGYEGRHGFSIRSSSYVTITNCSVTGVYADPIYLGVSTGGAPWAENITITNCTLGSNGRMGIGIVAAYNVLIDGNVIDDIRRSAIDLEPNRVDGGAEYVTISNNTFGAHRLYTIASGGYGGSIEHIVVDNNDAIDSEAFTMTVGPPDGGQRRGPITVTNNTAQGSHSGSSTEIRAPLSFRECDGITVTGNVFPLWPPDLEVLCMTTDCTDIDVSGNTWTGGDGEWANDGVIIY